ncbi:hypothetical protein K2X96_02440 [Patescibacteria group bacterium]|nr:hypothetical protein [Patescibacteria group bacterium]
MSTTKTLYILLGILTIILAGLSYYFLRHTEKDSSPTPEKGSIEELYSERQGSTFLIANTAFNARLYNPDSRPLLEQSLLEATSPIQEAHIKYKIALTYTYENPTRAVELMKEIAANATYPSQQKAYALQHIFRMYSSLVSGQIPLAKIFEGDPYQSFYTQGDTPLSLKKFHEYTLSFGESPISTAELAIWYADEVANNADLSQSEKENYVVLAKEFIATSEKYVDEKSEVMNDKELIPKTLVTLASAYGFLAQANIEPYRSNYGDMFIRAITVSDLGNTYQSNGARDAYAYFSLSLKDEAEWARAQVLFDELIDNIDSFGTMKAVYMRRQLNPSDYRDRTVFVANEYSKFKDFLITLGWTEEDFAR